MNAVSLFCFGYGFTAEALGHHIVKNGGDLAGTTKSEAKASAMSRAGIKPHIWNGDAVEPSWLDSANAILISVPPGDAGCPAFNAAHQAIIERRQKWRWIGYLSTNGVYGDHDGAWVDETSALRATSDRAKRRIAAEKQWLDLAVSFDLPVAIFRLPGIYGQGRSALDTVRNGKARRVFKQGQVFNRMHVEDIASVLNASMNRPLQHTIYNLADDEPAPPQDVVAHACALLNEPPPPLQPIDEADISPMAKSFYADNKRVSNQRMKQAFGVTLRYPTYREGLKAIADATARDDHGTKR